VAVHPRDNDLVVGTHGRGIWIVDDITPLRQFSQQLLTSDAAFIAARPVQQRIQGGGAAPTGAAVYVGENPPDGAVITYYQRTRHLFGRLALEILDANGTVIDELPASKRRGINRVVWPMRVKPPQVPPAAQLAFAGTQGPRVLPGTYAVRLTKGGQTYQQKLEVGLDRRASFTVADRKAQFDAAMRVHKLFGEESALLARINAFRSDLARAGQSSGGDPALAKQISALDSKVDAIRKQIVATTEGGAVTGEERLREHTDLLYGALLSYEGRPGTYHLERIEVLERQLKETDAQFAQVLARDVPAVDAALKAKGQAPLRK
jgi:hypothetical protein